MLNRKSSRKKKKTQLKTLVKISHRSPSQKSLIVTLYEMKD